MEVYPTAPPGVLQHDDADTAPPSAHAGGDAHMESSDTTTGVMGKVKRSARKFKDKIKKMAGSDSTKTDHGDVEGDQEDVLHPHSPGTKDEKVDKEAEPHGDDEEVNAHTGPADNQLKNQQLSTIGASDKQGNESEPEVRGGVPVSALATTPGPYREHADDNAPVTSHESGEPPDSAFGGDEKAISNTSDNAAGSVEEEQLRGTNQEPDSAGLPASAEAETSRLPAEPSSERGLSGNAATSDMDVAYPDDLVKPNPAFGQSSSLTHDKIGVMNDDNLPTDRHEGVQRTSEDFNNTGKENLLETSVPEFAELSGSQNTAPASAEADELVYRTVTDPDEGSSLTSPPETLDGVVNEPNENAESYRTEQSLDSSTRPSAQEIAYPTGVKNIPSEHSGHGEAAEPEKNQYGSYNNVMDEGSSFTSPPETSDGVFNEPNTDYSRTHGEDLKAGARSYGTGESLDNTSSDFANEGDHPSIHGEEKPRASENETDYPSTNDLNANAPSDGTGESLDNRSSAVANNTDDQSSYGEEKPSASANDTDYRSTSSEEKPISETTDGFNNLSLGQSPHGETAEQETNQQQSRGKWSADDKSSTDGLNAADVPRDGIGESFDDRSSAVANDTDYQSPYGEEKSSASANDTDYRSTSSEKKPISETTDGFNLLSLGQSPHGETAEQETNQQQSGGKWSADELNYSKNGSSTVLTGADNRSESELQQSNADEWSNNLVNVGADEERAPKLQDDNVGALSKPQALEDNSKDEGQEFYDSNDVNDDQFQEGFTRGSGDAEENALNSGSAIGKFQGPKNTDSYSDVSYPHTEGAVEEERPNIGGENMKFSPRQQQQPGFVLQGQKEETDPSTLGYGKELTPDDEGSYRAGGEQSHVAEGDCRPEADIDGSQLKTGGIFQGLKNSVSSKLGYGTPEKLHSPTEKTQAHETPVDTTADAQSLYDNDERGEHGSTKDGEREVKEGQLPGHSPSAEPQDATHDEVPALPSTVAEDRVGGGDQPTSYTQKFFDTTAAARDFLSSKVGYGNSN